MFAWTNANHLVLVQNHCLHLVELWAWRLYKQRTQRWRCRGHRPTTRRCSSFLSLWMPSRSQAWSQVISVLVDPKKKSVLVDPKKKCSCWSTKKVFLLIRSTFFIYLFACFSLYRLLNNNTIKNINHSGSVTTSRTTIPGLKQYTTYYFRVIGGDSRGFDAQGSQLSTLTAISRRQNSFFLFCFLVCVVFFL